MNFDTSQGGGNASQSGGSYDQHQSGHGMGNNTAPWFGGGQNGQQGGRPSYNQQFSQQGQQGHQGQQGGGIDPELAQLLHSMHGELQQTKQQNDKYNQQFDQLRKAFGGEQQEQPKADELAWYDEVLTRAMELDRAGQPIPTTVKIASQLANQQKTVAPLLQQVQELQNEIKALKNPQMYHDQNTFRALDQILTSKFEQNYRSPDSAHQDAVARSVAQEVARLRKEDPEVYNQLGRNPRLQEQLVNHYFQKAIPDAYRQMAEEEYLKNSEMTLDDVVDALQAAKQIQDPELRRKAKEKARHMLWEVKGSERKGDSIQSKLAARKQRLY